jgi:hypothetical protein
VFWTPAFVLIWIVILLLAIMASYDLVTFMVQGLSPTGFMVQPLLQLVGLEGAVMTLRALGIDPAFSVVGGILVPLWALVVILVMALLCCPLADFLSPSEALEADRRTLNPARHRDHPR